MPSEALKRWDPEEGPLLIKDCAMLPWQPQAGQFKPVSDLDDPLAFPFGVNSSLLHSLVHSIENTITCFERIHAHVGPDGCFSTVRRFSSGAET
jgi:hypothetical protein